MEIQEWQDQVDGWIKEYGVRYFDIKTNTILLMEEVGELARIIARMHGEQSFKKTISEKEQKQQLEEEIGDVMFVLTCIANQSGFSLPQILESNLAKKSKRDSQRHKSNPKLTSENT